MKKKSDDDEEETVIFHSTILKHLKHCLSLISEGERQGSEKKIRKHKLPLSADISKK